MKSVPRKLRRRTLRTWSVALFVAMIVLFARPVSGVLWGQDAQTKSDATATLLRLSDSEKFELGPNQKRLFRVESQADATLRISFQQTNEMMSVVWSDGGKAQVPRTNDAGLGSSIRFTVTYKPETQNLFEAACLHVHSGCSALVTVSASRPSSEEDVRFASEEEALAEAENVRRHGEKSSWPEALEKFREAAKYFESHGDKTLQRAALNGESRLLLYKLDDYHHARDAAKASTAIDPGDDDVQGQGLAWKTLASAEYFLGDYAASIQADKEAIALYKRAGDDYWQGILLGNLAYTYRETGDTEHALENSEAALEIARRVNDKYGVAFNLEALATFHLTRGELQRAFALYYDALDAIHAQPYPSVEAAVWSGLGDLFLQVNDDQRAEECFQKALPLAESSSDAAGMLKVTSDLGDLYLRQGRPKQALATLHAGLAKAKERGLVREQSLLSVNIGRSEAELGEISSARAAFQSAVDLATQIANKDAEAAALLHFGDFEFRQGKRSVARDLYARANTLWTQESNREQAAVALAALANLDADAGDLSKARSEIEDALGFFENSRATLPSRELRTSFFSSKHAYYDLGVSILMRLHEKDPAKGYAAEAFAISERGSSRELLDRVAAGSAPPFMHVPPDLLREQQLNRNRLDAMYERLRSLSDEAEKNSEQIAKLHVEIEELLRASDTLEGRIQEASGEYASLTGARPATASEIAARLDDRAALVKYWSGVDATYVWLISHDGFQSFAIAARRDEIRSLAARWLDSLQARSESRPGESLENRTRRIAAADETERRTSVELGNLLLSPLNELRDIQSLYVVADGPLASIPFAALRVAGRERTRAATPQALLSRFEVITEPSESILELLSQSRQPETRTPHIAVFADAVYSNSDPRVKGSHGGDSNPGDPIPTLRLATEAGMAHLPRLAGSRDEARAIETLNGSANTAIHLGFDALAESVRESDWSQFTAAHFGVHALLNTKEPAFSGIALTMVRPDGTPQNGVLWLSDIYSLPMPLNLVVLSGCHTATGPEIVGEGLNGISRAFFFAGARSVVGSLWSVEDRETGVLMQRFYEGLLRDKLSPAAALRRAQLAAMRSSATASPYYWAGFTVQGDGATQVTSLRPEQNVGRP